VTSNATTSRLSDDDWKKVAHLFSVPGPRKPTGRPTADARAVLDAILWIERTGERWIYLPAHFPAQQTCYAKYLQWKRAGLLAQVRALLDTDECCASEADCPRESP
jgi:transposase